MKNFFQNRFFGGLFSGSLAVLTALLFSGCGARIQEFQSVDTAMGTVVRQTLYVEGAGEEFARELTACVNRLEEEFLSWRLEDSEVFAVNAAAGTGENRELSGWMRELLERCREVCEASGGAFDVTLGSVARLWDIDTWAAAEQSGYVLPSDAEIAAALEGVGMDKLKLQSGTISLPEGMSLDLGAVGKGIALDELKSILSEQEEVAGAVISLGGSILTWGSKPDGGSWNVGVVDPFDVSNNLAILTLPGGTCVSTSGDYERYVEVDGVRYHHILDPATGRPAESGVKSVTILSESGFLSDALSTACFVLGVEEGLALAEYFQAEALFVDGDGEIFMTEGMERYLTPTT